jgi:hypothetical protein
MSTWIGQALVEIGGGCVEYLEADGAEEDGTEDEEDEFLNPPERRHAAASGKVLRGKIPGNPG